MVAIAQLVEPRIVIPVVVSSSLISHPIINRRVAQFGSATGLGPVGRRFKSYLADHFLFFKKTIRQSVWAFVDNKLSDSIEFRDWLAIKRKVVVIL